MLVRTFASAVTGINAVTVTIEEGFKGVIVPLKNTREAAVVGGLDVYGLENLGDVVDFFNGVRKFTPVKVDLLEIFASEANKYDVDFSEVREQENVKRALEVAAAGGHNIITEYYFSMNFPNLC
jgi:magnesium chelatase family protein